MEDSVRLICRTCFQIFELLKFSDKTQKNVNNEQLPLDL